jgi:hypothetical protein
VFEGSAVPARAGCRCQLEDRDVDPISSHLHLLDPCRVADIRIGSMNPRRGMRARQTSHDASIRSHRGELARAGVKVEAAREHGD